jgi:cytoskeletal protein CcmA (bactofilin family)
MFNARKPDSPFSATDLDKAPVASSYVAPSSSSAPKSAGRDANYSIINEWLTMRGDLESEGDILIKGKVIGNIRCKLLIIDVDAQIEGGITADEVVVRGKTKGTIEANKVRLEKSANVDSEISHVSFSAEEGARIKGALKFREEPINTSVKVVESKAA